MRTSIDLVQRLYETIAAENYLIAQGEVQWYQFCNRAKIHPTRDLARMFCGIQKISAIGCVARGLRQSYGSLISRIRMHNLDVIDNKQVWTITCYFDQAILEGHFFDGSDYEKDKIYQEIINLHAIDHYVKQIFGFNIVINDLEEVHEILWSTNNPRIDYFSRKLNLQLDDITKAWYQDPMPDVLGLSWPAIQAYLRRQFNLST